MCSPLGNFRRPQSVRSYSDGVIQSVCNLVEVFIEQVSIGVEGHRSLRVSRHPLHGLGVGPHTDGETGCRVAEIVRCDGGERVVCVSAPRDGWTEHARPASIRELGERGIVLRSLREGIDTSNATGRMVAGGLASLAELELELGRERRLAVREARRARGQSVGRPKALDASKAALAQRSQRLSDVHQSVWPLLSGHRWWLAEAWRTFRRASSLLASSIAACLKRWHVHGWPRY